MSLDSEKHVSFSWFLIMTSERIKIYKFLIKFKFLLRKNHKWSMNSNGRLVFQQKIAKTFD